MLENLSPLKGRYRPGIQGECAKRPGLRVQEKPATGLVQIAAWPTSVALVWQRLETHLNLPARIQPGRNAGGPARLAVQVSPMRMLVSGSNEECLSLMDLFDTETAVATDLGHSRICLHVTGGRVIEFLNRGLPVDLESLENDQVINSALHGVSLMVHKVGSDDFDIHMPRAFARFLLEWMEDTGRQFGVEFL